MALYAISDLHLSFSSDKPMDIYGEDWQNHTQRIKENWVKKINDNDTVLIPGDISWALRLSEAVVDLQWIADLPGKKIMGKGNHDPWWTSLTKLNRLHDGMKFLQNDFYSYGEYAICGTRGWICPNDAEFTNHDIKIYQREVIRLELSFQAACKAGYQKFIGMMHYPPTNEKKQPSDFTVLFEKYQTEKVVFGHLHGEKSRFSSKEEKNGVEYLLVACDYLKCSPLLILE